MLIFEPQHYSKLSANDGDKIFDYYSGAHIGKVIEVYPNENIQVINVNGSQWVYTSSGVSYQAKINERLDTRFFKYFKIAPHQTNKVFNPLANRIKIC